MNAKNMGSAWARPRLVWPISRGGLGPGRAQAKSSVNQCERKLGPSLVYFDIAHACSHKSWRQQANFFFVDVDNLGLNAYEFILDKSWIYLVKYDTI